MGKRLRTAGSTRHSSITGHLVYVIFVMITGVDKTCGCFFSIKMFIILLFTFIERSNSKFRNMLQGCFKINSN